MRHDIRKAYNLLVDFSVLEKNNVIDPDDIKNILSKKLSHKYSKSIFGRLYLRYYYLPMIVSALSKFDKGHYLELGCGTGTQVLLAKHMGFKSVLGIDLIPERIKIAFKRAQYYNLSESIDFKVEDFWKIKLATPVDAVYSMFAFELFGIPPANACRHLSSLCSQKKVIVILDIGNVKRLYNENYFIELVSGFEEQGFIVSLEPLIPFFVNSFISKVLGKYNLHFLFRAVRLIAIRP